MEHVTVEANGATFHVARAGEGAPLLLLHGWPEFWFAWEPVIQRLAGNYTLIAPDLRGFGDSDKPSGPFGPDGHAADMRALLGALGVQRAGVVGHDVGGPVMQFLARAAAGAISIWWKDWYQISFSRSGWPMRGPMPG
jgi:pimeloyl-ACP methyl ester carboxylesterase